MASLEVFVGSEMELRGAIHAVNNKLELSDPQKFAALVMRGKEFAAHSGFRSMQEANEWAQTMSAKL